MADSWCVCGTTAATEWAKMMAGVNRAGLPGQGVQQDRGQEGAPAKVAMAPAVWRMIEAEAQTEEGEEARKAPD